MTNDRFTIAYCSRINLNKGGWALTNQAVCAVCPNKGLCKVRQPIMPNKDTDLYIVTRNLCQKVGTFKKTINGVDIDFESETDTTPDSEEGNNIPN